MKLGGAADAECKSDRVKGQGDNRVQEGGKGREKLSEINSRAVSGE